FVPPSAKTLELMRKLGNPNGDKRSMMPLRWYRFLKGDDQYGPHFRLMNGSIIQLKTGNVALREGECHFALYNEGQQMEESGFVEVRAATSDFGGMTIVTANPPKAKKGLWIEEFHDDVKRGYKVAFDGTQGRREATMFAFDPRKNPYAEHKSLHALKFETDEKTYARDALGLIVPIGDVAIHAFSKSESVRVPWPGLQDITRQVTKKHCRKVASWLLGSDFDKVPHLATSVSKIFRDPEQPNLLIYFVLYVLYVSEGDEEAMVREIFALELEDGSHLHAKDVVVVGDASGDWQDVQRRRGRHSFDVYRNAGLRVVKPDPKAEDNPRRIDRFAVTNAAFKNAAGYRQTYVHPRCREVIIDLASLERRNGVPYAGSPHAHGVDCVSYPVYRVFCHRRRKGRIGYEGKKPHPFTAGMKSW
ncbi:MAG: hypothetical protein MJE77_46725, partial [Proteobacteria bacterium]|nr:hypothetical protein [Pseudomonadota bacterium]